MQADFLELQSGALTPPLPLRKAAMLLHSMGDVDRRWMLARLEPGQRSRIEELLAELQALDFPVDAALVRESLETTRDVGSPATAAGIGMSGWSAEEAASVLLAEPDDLVALVLRAGDWAWAPAFRARLGSIRIRAVEASRYSLAADVSTVLQDAAVKAAIARLAGMAGSASARRVL